MKIIIYLIFTSFLAFAQLEIGLSLNQKKFLIYEPIYTTIYLINKSNHKLDFSNLYSVNNYVNINITNDKNEIVDNIKNINLAQNLILQPGLEKKIKINISKYFSLFKSGKYKISVIAAHDLIKGVKFKSQYELFSVSQATLFKKVNFGVFSPKEKQIKIRNYEILIHKKTVYTYYYLRILDNDYIYGQYNLGVQVLGVKIYDLLDSFNNIHILNQIGAKEFHYMVFSPNGKIRQKSVYKSFPNNSPKLLKNYNTGRVFIHGGVKSEDLVL